MEGAQFEGTTTFMPRDWNKGCMQYDGILEDKKADGNSVYVHSKVVGYDWDDNGRVDLVSGNGTQRYASKCINDRAATYVPYGWVEVCVNRQPLLQDRCQRGYFERPENYLPAVIRDIDP